MNDPVKPKPWSDLDQAARAALIAEHQAWLDTQPPTCSLDAKTERFVRWLAERGIDFSPARDMPPTRPTPAWLKNRD